MTASTFSIVRYKGGDRVALVRPTCVRNRVECWTMTRRRVLGEHRERPVRSYRDAWDVVRPAGDGERAESIRLALALRQMTVELECVA